MISGTPRWKEAISAWKPKGRASRNPVKARQPALPVAPTARALTGLRWSGSGLPGAHGWDCSNSTNHCQAANGAICDVDPSGLSLLNNTVGLGAVPGCYEGALRLTTADSTPRTGALILPCVRSGVIIAAESLSFIRFGSKLSCRSAVRTRSCWTWGGVRCAMWFCAASVDV